MDSIFDDLGFWGSYEHALDTQGRLAIPSEWRSKDVENRFVLFPSGDGALLLFPMEIFGEFIAAVRKQPFNMQLQSALAWLGSQSRKLVCDKQGRIKLEKEMLTKAGISDNNIRLVGAISHIRLCSQEAFETLQARPGSEYLEELQKSGDQAADAMRILGDFFGGNKK